ncbi:hypothetical protein [Streptomyces goshikiensis]|uniref:hypothetical protein n=1 Tax=Streptomyces goshikiensis TaxID=1942 RepID=UPI00365E1A7F
MCHPAWARALTEAQRLKDLERLRPVRDRTDREHARPPDAEAPARGAERRTRQAGGELTPTA